MGHFIINLPDGRLGDVRFGTVSKKMLFLDIFSKNKIKSESKTGYVVRIDLGKRSQEEYWLYKSKEGKWSRDPDGTIELDSDIYRSLQNAIMEKESPGIDD